MWCAVSSARECGYKRPLSCQNIQLCCAQGRFRCADTRMQQGKCACRQVCLLDKTGKGGCENRLPGGRAPDHAALKPCAQSAGKCGKFRFLCSEDQAPARACGGINLLRHLCDVRQIKITPCLKRIGLRQPPCRACNPVGQALAPLPVRSAPNSHCARNIWRASRHNLPQQGAPMG